MAIKEKAVDSLIAVAASAQARLESGRRQVEARRERGDMMGWVIVAVMTVGVVIAIFAFLRPQLETMLKGILGKVNP